MGAVGDGINIWGFDLPSVFTGSKDYRVIMVGRSGGGGYAFTQNLTDGGYNILHGFAGGYVPSSAYALIGDYGAGGAAGKNDYARIPNSLWLPTPLLYDTFTRSNGAIGSSETLGPDGQTTLASSWASLVGTVQVSGNKARASVLSGGVAIAGFTSSKSDIIASVDLTKGTTGAGLVLRYQDSSNYWIAYHDGTNCVLAKVISGTPTTVITGARTYVAARPIIVSVQGNVWNLYYGYYADSDVWNIGSLATDATFNSATTHGIYFADTDSTLDNATFFPIGSSNEYYELDRY
jgi:hypothetical protein